MAMRLNANMRAQVVKKALDHTFKKKLDDNNKEALALGNACWMEVWGDVQKHINKLPKPWFEQEPLKMEHTVISEYGMRYNITFNVGGQRVPFFCDKRLPSNHIYNNSTVVIRDQALVDRARKWQSDTENLKKAYATAKQTLEAMLKAQPTYERLEKDWPEGRPFYKSLPVDYPYQHQVPAVQVSALNHLLGLS